MTEGVAVAVITAVGGIIIALLGKVAVDNRRTRKQVENSHIKESGEPYNLRENIDDNQAALLKEIREVRRDISGIRRDVGRLDERDLEHGRHHTRVDSRLAVLDEKIDEHLAWSLQYVTSQGRPGNGSRK